MRLLRHGVGRILRDECGQDAFEYLIVTGALLVAFVIALLTFDTLVGLVLGQLCPSVDTANPFVAIGTCITG